MFQRLDCQGIKWHALNSWVVCDGLLSGHILRIFVHCRNLTVNLQQLASLGGQAYLALLNFSPIDLATWSAWG